MVRDQSVEFNHGCRIDGVHVRIAPQDSVYDAVFLILSLVVDSCTPEAKKLVAARRCKLRARLCFEERLAVAQPPLKLPSEDLAAAGFLPRRLTPKEQFPRILAARIGINWDHQAWS